MVLVFGLITNAEAVLCVDATHLLAFASNQRFLPSRFTIVQLLLPAKLN